MCRGKDMALVPRMGRPKTYNTPSILLVTGDDVSYSLVPSMTPGMTRHPPPSKSCVSGSSSAHSWKWRWKHWAVCCCTSMARNPYNMHNLKWSDWLYNASYTSHCGDRHPIQITCSQNPDKLMLSVQGSCANLLNSSSWRSCELAWCRNPYQSIRRYRVLSFNPFL